MNDVTYFILAMFFNYWRPALLAVLLVIGWSEVGL